ncbi:MAG TPA: serine/threonine-protein kinase [Nannocystaceae bacterium]|nr:serine/threonine-protein kinase [Nannocystaceae bacterium]
MNTAGDDDDLDADLDDPLLRSVAAAPPIALGEERLPEGTILAQSYRIHRELGAGGMGVVYEATDLVLSRRIALKVHEIGPSDRAARVWREARAMARLAHPHVVAVYEVGVDGSRGYIAMELVDGTNARQWIAAQPRTWLEIVEVYRQAGRGLAAAHDADIVHRDFKPDNVLVTPPRAHEGVRVRVADFGLALDPGTHTPVTSPGDRRRESVTLTGATVGTPEYMAPEQATNRRADARSDQYAFCVALFEALHGRRPDEPGMANREVPPWLDEVLRRGLASDPAQRYVDMHALVAALDPAPHGDRRARRFRFGGLLLAGAALLAAGRWVAQADDDPCADAAAAIDGSWSSAHKDALRQALAGVSGPLRDATLNVLEPGFDAWADAWRAAASDACAATHVRGQQSSERLDARSDCLERARARFAAAIALYDDADVDAMVSAERLVAQLPDVAMCARPDAAITTDLVTPERAEVHAQLTAQLDRAVAEAAVTTSRGQQALDALIPTLEQEGFAHSLAEARRLRGRLLLDMGRRDDAIVDLSAAHTLALAGTDRDALAVTQVSLASAVGRTSAGYAEAERLLAGAQALAEDLDWSARRMNELRVTAFEIAFYNDRYADVERMGHALLDEPTLDDGPRARVMTLLATALERQSRFEEALAAHDRALEFVERVRGPDHMQVAMVLGNRVHSLAMLSRGDEARRSLDRVLAIRRAVFGPESPIVGEVYRQIGDAEANAGNREAAAKNYEQSIAIHRKADDDAGLFFALGNYGHLRNEMNQRPEAARLMDESLVHAERAFGPDSVRVGQALGNRGDVSLALGEYAVAAAQLERALAILRAKLPADDLSLGITRLSYGEALVHTGRVDAGIAEFEDAMRIVTEKLPAQRPEQLAIIRSHAKLLEAAGRHEAALARSREAAARADELLPADHADRIATWMKLSERLAAAGRHDEAKAARERARSASP